jgi:hypothetical protein
MTDFSSRAASQTGPGRALRPITPDDAADLPEGMARSLYVSGAGAVALLDATGARAVIQSAGCQYHPIHVTRVLASGTTATGLVAIY